MGRINEAMKRLTGAPEAPAENGEIAAVSRTASTLEQYTRNGRLLQTRKTTMFVPSAAAPRRSWAHVERSSQRRRSPGLRWSWPCRRWRPLTRSPCHLRP